MAVYILQIVELQKATRFIDITNALKEGCPLDNAVIENWHSLLKKETLHNNDYQDIYEYVNGVFDWIWLYKTERISLSERQHNINENMC